MLCCQQIWRHAVRASRGLQTEDVPQQLHQSFDLTGTSAEALFICASMAAVMSCTQEHSTALTVAKLS
jgi:hypothetical protein